VFIDGKHAMTLRGTYEELSKAFQKLVDDYVASKYPLKADKQPVAHGQT
jgi:hypothetical protein